MMGPGYGGGYGPGYGHMGGYGPGYMMGPGYGDGQRVYGRGNGYRGQRLCWNETDSDKAPATTRRASERERSELTAPLRIRFADGI